MKDRNASRPRTMNNDMNTANTVICTVGKIRIVGTACCAVDKQESTVTALHRLREEMDDMRDCSRRQFLIVSPLQYRCNGIDEACACVDSIAKSAGANDMNEGELVLTSLMTHLRWHRRYETQDEERTGDAW